MSDNTKMSVRMLDDEAAMNRLNPYVTSGPGTVRRVEKFSAFTVPEEEDAQFEIREKGPLYSRGIPIGGPTKDPMCPMSRPLYPERNIDTGLTKPKKILVEKVHAKRRYPRWLLVLAVLILLVLLILRR